MIYTKQTFRQRFTGGRDMDNHSKYELATRIEYILNYLLSRKHNMNVKIELEKEKYLNGNTNQTGDFKKE